MTGCGYGRIQGEQVIVTVEVKSVNSRYLDINCKLPRAYSRIEEKIKAFAGKYTTRGKLDIYVTVETAPGAAGTLFQIDEAYLLNYLECLEQLRDKFGLRDDISVMRVAQNKDVFTGARQEDTADELWERALPALEKAFEEFAGMKKSEGTRLKADLLQKIDVVEEYVSKIEVLSPEIVSQYEKRLTERIEELCNGLEIDKGRIIEEVAIFADRVAVDEELVRLKSHIKQFREIVGAPDDSPCGRKLDFLLQEINREINTTGSKCNSSEIAKVVVDAKSETEKIREQIQNIE